MIDFIKDADCTKETPVRLGVPDAPIYGKGIKLKPRVDGRTDSEHFKKIYLPELLPLEEYDLIVVLISGGKDSVACCLMKIQECVQSMETVIFPLSVIQKILIGCSYRVSSTETLHFLLVIIVGIRMVLVGVSLYLGLVGMMAWLPVLSIGF